MKSHRFTLILISAIIAGAMFGSLFGASASKLKPLGDLFLNLIFTSVIPLIFFSIASAIAEIQETRSLLKITATMLIIFVLTSFIAACFMLICVKLFPLAPLLSIPLKILPPTINTSFSNQIVSIISVPDFLKLFSRDNMLALIIFSALVGIATTCAKEKGELVAKFLVAGREVSFQLLSLIMLFAPVGFFAFFAQLISQMGENLVHAYAHVTLLYYSAALGLFIFGSSFYAFLAGNFKAFWQHIFLPATTALATCSSAASIPANLVAAEKIGVPKSIAELVIPLGNVIHKDGSVLGGIVKIAFLFGLFHLPFSGASTLLTAILVSILVGTVMGAIPSGGMIGEMLIISFYGFPPQALLIIAVISMIIDPPATLVSVASNTVCSMLVTRIMKKTITLEEIARQ